MRALLVLFAAFALLATGCHGGKRDVYTTSTSTYPDGKGERIEVFDRGDYPLVIVRGYKGKRVTIELRNLDDNTIVTTRANVRIGKRFADFDFPQLEPGSYDIRLMFKSEWRDSWRFTIRR